MSADLFDSNKMKVRFHWYERLGVFLTESHCLAVEATLDQLIFGVRSESDGTLPTGSYIPRPEDALMLLSAIRLRCIGLLWGIFKEERTPSTLDLEQSKPTDPSWERNSSVDRNAVQDHIATFAKRSSRYVQDVWRLNCGWSNVERAVLANVIGGYVPNTDLEPLDEDLNGFNIRKMAYLLRVATVCSVTTDVCPLEIRLRLKPDECCDPRKSHLNAVKWISGLTFDYGRHAIEFFAAVPQIDRVPPPGETMPVLPVATLDYQLAVEFFAYVVQGVLDTVKGYLGQCSNTDFQTVRLNCKRISGFGDPQSYLPDHWLLPFAASANAAEVAGVMALILRSFCDFGFEDGASLSSQIKEVCLVASQLHPFNALIYQLVENVRRWTNWDGEPNENKKTEFREELNNYLLHRERAGNTVADEAQRLGVLNEADIVVVYGYGRCVLSTLVRSKFAGKVLLVTVDEDFRGPWVKHEEERLVAVLEDYSISYEEVALGEVSAKLANLTFEGKRVVFLCGTRCVLAPEGESRTFLSPIGNRSLAITVRDFGGRVVLLAEGDKVLSKPTNCDDFRERIKERLQKPSSRPWHKIDLLEELRHIDQVIIAGDHRQKLTASLQNAAVTDELPAVHEQSTPQSQS